MVRPVFPSGLLARDAFARVVKYLQQHQIQDTHQSAQNFLTSLFKISYREYPNYSHQILTDEQLEKLGDYCLRRAHHEPIQYIVGDWDFYGRTFLCRQPILIPRPETETLIERILNSKILDSIPSPKILDIGCGSGVIGLTLAAELPHAHCTAIDIDSQAIALASLNCSNILCKNCLSSSSLSPSPASASLSSPSLASASLSSPSLCCRYHLHHNDLLSFFQQSSPPPSSQSPSSESPSPESAARSYDLIVSNPPYVPTAELYSTSSPLQREVFHYESHVALDGGPQHGLHLIRDILLHSSASLRPQGTKELWMEVHDTHPQLIQESYEKSKNSRRRSLTCDTPSPSPSASSTPWAAEQKDILAGCWESYDLVDSYPDLFSKPRFVRFRKRDL
jgi:release factor glutamine methyltransferase